MRKEVSIGVVALIRSAGNYKVLLIKQSSGNHWTFCKGHIEKYDKTHLDTASRELLEEVNLTVKEWLLDSKTFENNYQFERNGITVDKTNVFYVGLVDNVSHLKTQQSEILECTWAEFQFAVDKLTYDTDKQILKDVFLELNKH
eukprot:NODE_377_length_9768_cov_0.153584.p6 type:complete len:144 gc:universal NODE_377_length_9768_cov_0.153584:6624-6193(-)